MSDRAPHIFGYCFILCYRCTFFLVGAILGLAISSRIERETKKYKGLYTILVSVILFLPLLIDGLLQYFFGIESNNIRRAITGFLGGIGSVFLSVYIINNITKNNKTIKNKNQCDKKH